MRCKCNFDGLLNKIQALKVSSTVKSTYNKKTNNYSEKETITD